MKLMEMKQHCDDISQNSIIKFINRNCNEVSERKESKSKEDVKSSNTFIKYFNKKPIMIIENDDSCNINYKNKWLELKQN